MKFHFQALRRILGKGEKLLKSIGLSYVLLLCTGFQFIVQDCGDLIGKWRTDGGPTVRYMVDAGSLSKLTYSTGNASTALSDILAAADAWTTQSGSSFKFVYSGTFDFDGKFHLKDYCDKDNEDLPANKVPARVYVANTEPTDPKIHPSVSNPATTAWVIAYYCRGPYANNRFKTAQIKGFELWINPAKTWASGNSSLFPGVDLKATITHEFGHGLGLLHNKAFTEKPPSITDFTNNKVYGVTSNYPGIVDPPCDSSNPSNYAAMCKFEKGMAQRTLQADDLQGIYALYGPPTSPKISVAVNERMPQANGNGDGNNEDYWIKSAWTQPVTNFGDAAKTLYMDVQYTDCHRQSSGWIQRAFRTDTFHYGETIEAALFLCKRCAFSFPFFYNDKASYRFRKWDNYSRLTNHQIDFNDWVSPFTGDRKDHVCIMDAKIGVNW